MDRCCGNYPEIRRDNAFEATEDPNGASNALTPKVSDTTFRTRDGKLQQKSLDRSRPFHFFRPFFPVDRRIFRYLLVRAEN
jgi:hypothetical protein